MLIDHLAHPSRGSSPAEPSARWRLSRFAVLLVGVMGATATSGCEDSCAELEEVCALCPEHGLGPTARESCLRAVATEDDHTCDEALEQQTYRAFGCR